METRRKHVFTASHLSYFLDDPTEVSSHETEAWDVEPAGDAPVSGLADAIARTLDRDLERLVRELDAYPDEESLWRSAPGIRNPGGVLANHLAGNLLHYVGAVLGNSGYVRNRAVEFERRDVPLSQLLVRIERARVVVDEVVPELDPAGLQEPFPEPPASMAGIETGRFLLHLVSHLAYHLGQVNYHRRLVAPGEPED